jgi:hypothetical protein
MSRLALALLALALLVTPLETLVPRPKTVRPRGKSKGWAADGGVGEDAFTVSGEGVPSLKSDGDEAAGSPWCPKYHYQPGESGDPDAPMRRAADDTWHLYYWPSHFTSKDLLHWKARPRMTDVGDEHWGLTGSMSFTESGYIIHNPLAGYIGKAVPNGTGDLLDDFDDSSCCPHDPLHPTWPQGGGCTGNYSARCAFRNPPAVVGPGKPWFNFMDSPSRALKLSDGRWYMATAGYCCPNQCRGNANPCPEGMGIPWFVDSSPELNNLSFAGYLHNITSSLGSFSPAATQAKRWLSTPTRNALNACPDIFPIGPPNASLFALIDSFFPSYTAEWFIGTLKPGTHNYANPAFTQLARGVVDYGGMFAPKTGADDVIDQRQSTRRVLFSDSEDLVTNQPGEPKGENVYGCAGMSMLMPRELSLGVREDKTLFLRMAPLPEMVTLRGTERHGATPVLFNATGSQVEVRVACASNTTEAVRVEVLRSEDERLAVSYSRFSRTLTIDHRHANAQSPAKGLVQEAPYGAEDAFELRIFVDGGLVQTFLDEAVTVTSLVNLSAVRSSPTARGVSVNTTGSGCSVSVWPLSL